MLPVPLLDLRPQYHALRDELHARVAAVMESQQFILGPEVSAFEAKARDYCRAGFAVGMSSGTDAQIAVLMAMGIGPGDAVITTPFTFFATAGCVWRMGARAVFCDIDADTFNLSPAAVERYLREQARRDPDGTLRTPQGERLRAIIPVHLFGMCADMAPLLRLGEEWGLAVIEDASQAIGAECPLPGGTVGSAGAMGEWGWYSFFPSKNLGAFGDAGLATGRAGQDEALLRAVRMHGMTTQYYHDLVGGNFRLDALQAAVLSVKLPHLDAWSDARRSQRHALPRAFRRRRPRGARGRANHGCRPSRGPARPACGIPHLPPVCGPRAAAGRPARAPARRRGGLRGVLPVAAAPSEMLRRVGRPARRLPRVRAGGLRGAGAADLPRNHAGNSRSASFPSSRTFTRQRDSSLAKRRGPR